MFESTASRIWWFVSFWGAFLFSYHCNHSWLWAIVHGICGWIYIAVKLAMLYL